MPAGLVVPVTVMLTVNITGARGIGEHFSLMCIWSSAQTLKSEINSVWLLFVWTRDFDLLKKEEEKITLVIFFSSGF